MRLGAAQNITFTGNPPSNSNLLFQLQKRSATGNYSDWVIIKFTYTEDTFIVIRNKDTEIPPTIVTGYESDLDMTVCGSKKIFHRNHSVHFAVTDDSNFFLTVSVPKYAKLIAHFDKTTDDFKKTDLFLFIDTIESQLALTNTSRIRVIEVFKGSIGVVIYCLTARK